MEQRSDMYVNAIGTNDLKNMQLCLERDRLLASEEFARSPLMTQLLKYLVEKQLLDNAEEITSQKIAAEALGKKSEDGNDANVYARVQIGRLRQVMDGFYAKHGGTSRLHLPNGQYRFELVPIDAKFVPFEVPEPASEIQDDTSENLIAQEERYSLSSRNDNNDLDEEEVVDQISRSSDYTKIYYLSATALVIALIIFIFAR